MQAASSLCCLARKKPVPVQHTVFKINVSESSVLLVSHGRTLVSMDGHVQLVPHHTYKHAFAEAKGQICCRNEQSQLHWLPLGSSDFIN